jgi:hypothetical protein
MDGITLTSKFVTIKKLRKRWKCRKMGLLKGNAAQLHFRATVIVTHIVFIYGLFNDAVSSSDYRPIASNETMINEIMNWKGYGRKESWPNLRF